MLPHTLIRSKRRTLSIQINKNGELIVRAPMRMSVGFIEDFIEKKQDWIKKHQERARNTNTHTNTKDYSETEVQEMKQKLREYVAPRVQELWEGENLPKYTSIKITKSEGRWGSCSARNGLCFSYRLAEYLQQTQTLTQTQMNQNTTLRNYNTNVSVSSVCVCSPFIDAIIIHELAHLREKNHQKPFWNLVYSMMPEYEKVMARGKVASC